MVGYQIMTHTLLPNYLSWSLNIGTLEQLLSWKPDSYNHFQSNHFPTLVRKVSANKDICVLKAYFDPSQCTDKAHDLGN